MIINVTVPPISRVVKVGTASVNAGKDGKSAYQIAVDNGFIGTEAAWLASLNGVNGAPGPANSLTVDSVLTLGPTTPAIVLIEGEAPNQTISFGIPRGAKGDVGPAGPQGIQGPVGEAGPQGPQGLPGKDGIDGVDGTNGIDGKSAYQVWLDTGNTGTEADFLASLVGATGPLGPAGEQGLKGDKGDKGDTGPQGIQGIQGPQGPTGLTGPQGPEGAAGLPGVGVPVGGTAGQALVKLSATDYDTAWQTISGGTGSPGGANAQIQFNSSGSFAGDANLTWDGTKMTAGGVLVQDQFGTGEIKIANLTSATRLYTDGTTNFFTTSDVESGNLQSSFGVGQVGLQAGASLVMSNDGTASGATVALTSSGPMYSNTESVIFGTWSGAVLGLTSSGAIQIGTNASTGTAGQVLTSNGSSAASWLTLASVATSGSYTDLKNKPDIPTLPSQTGQTGKFLSTDGTSLSWASAGAGGSTFFKDPVRVATTASGTLATSFASGQSIDGVTLATGNRILIKDQSTASQNGIYVVNATGAPTRATDFDENSEAQRGCIVYVQEGSRNGGSNFQVVSSDANPVVIGTSTINFSPANSFMVAGSSSMKPEASGTNAIAIGNAKGLGNFSIGIGIGAEASTTEAIGIGRLALASGAYSIALGRSSASTASRSVSMGYQANGAGDDSLALGSYSSTSKSHSVAIKAGKPSTNQSMAWGPYSKITAGQTYQRETFFYGGNTTSSTPTNLSHCGADPLSLGAWMHYEIRATVQATNMTTLAYNSGKFAGEYRWVISTNGDASRLFVLSPKTTIYEYNPYGLPWSLEAVVVNPGILQFQASGEASTTIRWFVTVELTSMYCAN